jgi:hypothetical protein
MFGFESGCGSLPDLLHWWLYAGCLQGPASCSPGGTVAFLHGKEAIMKTCVLCWSAGAALVCAMALPAAAQSGSFWPPQMQVAPSCVHPESHVVATLFGQWPDRGPPDRAQVVRIGQEIDINVESPGSVLPAISEWSLAAQLGRLPAGTYTVYSRAFAAQTGAPVTERALVGTIIVDPSCPVPCYANCDGSVAAPVLNVEDFACFINEFSAAQMLPHDQQVLHYANCDGSVAAPVLNVEDFSCFVNRFAQGCP